MRHYTLFIYILLALLPAGAVAQNATLSTAEAAQDTAMSTIDSLQQELQELKMRELVMRNALEASGKSAREDSIRRAQQQQRIDSLRQVTPGTPVVIEGDTLLLLYTGLGGESLRLRADDIARRILLAGKTLALTPDSVHLFESEYTSDIMCGETVMMRVSDLDGLWNGMSRQELAEQYQQAIAQRIDQLQRQYGLKTKLKEVGWAFILIVAQIVLFVLTARLIRRLRQKTLNQMHHGMSPLIIKGYTLLNIRQRARIQLIGTRVLQILLVLAQLLISLPLLFSIFPETAHFTRKMIYYVWVPLRDIMLSTVGYIPNLIKIVLVIYLVHWILRVVRHMANEIEAGRLKFDRFYSDWAKPTYQIFRIFAIAFTLIVIWPLLPGSDSGVFKGVSIFVAALFSLGSTTTIGNLISGIIITYMRPFVIGDFVRIGESEGTVIEQNAFITRLRDIKNNIVTVPNNSILQLQTLNYTAAVRRGGLIVHSDFTFTYKVPRATIEKYLIEGAMRCHLLSKHPKPFVLVTQLEDFYTRYEINAYTRNSHQLPDVYSELHKHILDVFREHDLEPTSSHFVTVKQ